MLIKKINRCGQVLIPKQIQKQLDIQDGDFLYIYYHKGIIAVEKIENPNQNKQLNQCILSNGRLSIPAELRRILKINLGTPLIMETSISDKKIYLRQSYTLLSSKEA